MMLQSIDNLVARDVAFVAALEASLPNGRIVKEEFKHMAEWPDADVLAGVVIVLSGGERDYTKGFGKVAKDGTQQFILISHLKLAEPATQKQVKEAEYAIMEEIKTFCRTGVPGMSLELDNLQQSRQIEANYGWVVAYINAGPPTETTH